jgi:DNA-binding transcriptional regulator YdaS (Cro superfamily)
MDLKTWLNIRGVTQKKLAEELGLSPSYFSELLSGKRRFNPKLAHKVEKLTKGEVSRMGLLYPERSPSKGIDIEYRPPDFIDRGSPLTPEMRVRVLNGELTG